MILRNVLLTNACINVTMGEIAPAPAPSEERTETNYLITLLKPAGRLGFQSLYRYRGLVRLAIGRMFPQ